MNTSNRIPASIAVLTRGSHGIYVPQVFIESYAHTLWHIRAEDAAALQAGPNDKDDAYWSAWEHVLDTAYIVNDGGYRYQLMVDGNDGDLLAVCNALLTPEEYLQLYGETMPPADDACTFTLCEKCFALIIHDHAEDDATPAALIGAINMVAGYEKFIAPGEFNEFSAATCECCGTKLAGARHKIYATPRA